MTKGGAAPARKEHHQRHRARSPEGRVHLLQGEHGLLYPNTTLAQAKTCTFSAPGTGTYSIVLRGFSAYAGVPLKVSYTAPSGSYFNLSGATGSQQLFTYPVAAGQTVTFTLAPNAGGSTGDADLYVRFGSAPTLAVYDCKTALSGSTERCTVTAPAAGTYSVMVYGYSAYTGVDLSSR